MNPSTCFTRFAAVAAALALLAGCGKVPASAAPSGSGQTAEAGSALSSGPVQELTAPLPYQLFSQGTGSEEGFYYVEPTPANSLAGQLRYVDYASGLDVPLSAQVNSDHSDETDISYLDSIEGDYRLFLSGGQLYFLRSDAVYRMEPDGSGRRLVYQCDRGDLLMCAAADASQLYLFQRAGQDIQVLRVPKEGGSAATHTLTTLDPATGQLTELADLCPDDTQYAEPYMAGETLLLFYPNDGLQLAICDEKGQPQRTLPLTAQGEALRQTEQPYVIGDTFLLPCWDEQLQQGCQLLVDTVTGEVSRSDLCLSRDDGTSATLSNQRYGYSLVDKDQFTAASPQLTPIQRS
ncbi:hypothetical protein B5G38_06375 [Gemmiger sp. An87]|nr:hypothetical protein B5G38_06375 [Gemmiger sp. An87]